MQRLAALILAVVFLGVSPAQGAEPAVPPELEPWRDWALHGQEHRVCPFFATGPHGDPSRHVCAWPGSLRFVVTASGADFAQAWRLYEEAWVPLPGDPRAWPLDVRAGGRAQAVVLREGSPQVLLPAGEHRLEGRMSWSRRPANIRVAPQTGLLSLRVGGAEVAFPQMENGRLWLGGKPPGETRAAEALRITVHRLLADGMPLTLTTRLRLEVSGRAREVALARVLPEGFLPMAMSGPLPARIEADGRLRVQVRPGEWQINIVARAAGVPDRVSAPPAGDGQWAESEIWSWRSNDRLRVTVAEGGEPVDPARVDVPGEWNSLPAFRINPGESLAIAERSRGLSGERENRLGLQRRMWLDFEGGAFTIVDRISGEMQTGWRLDMLQPYALRSASLNGENLLVTTGASAAHTGVEIRDLNLNLEAIGRVDAASDALPATGWQQDFATARTFLYLPPGHRLIAALGVDQSSGDWLGYWRLLDYFLVLLIAVSIGRLFSRFLGVLTLLLLALAYHEPGAPVWAWLAVAVGVALARYTPEGRLRTLGVTLRNLAIATLVLLSLPFAAQQLRLAIFPQLETPRVMPGELYDGWRDENATLAPAAAPAEDGARLESFARKQDMAEEIVVSARRSYGNALERYAPGALVQTGPGVPRWTANASILTWNGPVTATQDLRLVVLPAWAARMLRVLGVGLLAFLIWRIARTSLGRRGQRTGAPGSSGTANGSGPASTASGIGVGLTSALITTIFAVLPDPALAQSTPDPALLKELRARLLQAPECVPVCAGIAEAQLLVTPQGIDMDLGVDALESVALALPGSPDGWAPQQIEVDGTAVRLLYRDQRDVLWLPVGPGRSRVKLSGQLPPADSLTIPFPEPPRRITLSVAGWEASGVADESLVSGALELVRIKSATSAAKDATLEPERVAAFVRVVRTLTFGVDWKLDTSVVRLAPEKNGFTVSIPLLDGERPLDERLEVVDGNVQVGIAAGARSRDWQSTLAMQSPLTLVAADDPDYTEVWQVVPSAIWRLGFEGVPSTAPQRPVGVWSPEFYPRPGETLTLLLDRPEAVTGRTLVFDSVRFDLEQGQRGSVSSLELGYRSTRGGQYTIRLPESARVMEVTSDGAPQSNRPVDGVLSVAVLPGAHQLGVRWNSEDPVRMRTAIPPVDIGAQAGNVSQTLRLPRDRWVLFTRGPQLGPAVLYWSELLAFVALALALGRFAPTPLRTHHWLLLGIGFSTFSWGMLALLGGWIFSIAWIERSAPPERDGRFNLRQLGIAAYSLVTLAALLIAIPRALLGSPDMHVLGNQSHAYSLTWFSDRVDGLLPTPMVLSVPLWVYKAAILLWALWLAFALVSWIPWSWRAWSKHGIWRGAVIRRSKQRPPTDEEKA